MEQELRKFKQIIIHIRIIYHVRKDLRRKNCWKTKLYQKDLFFDFSIFYFLFFGFIYYPVGRYLFILFYYYLFNM